MAPRGRLRRAAAAVGPPPEPLDLTGSYQTPASQFERIRSYPWRVVVPRGSQTLGNVPLAIDGMLVLWGEANAKSGAVFPEKVDDIPVCTASSTPCMSIMRRFTRRATAPPVYHLTLQYEDGTSSMTTICYGTHVRDWWQTADERVTALTDSGSRKWSGVATYPDRKGESPITLRFFVTSITNPRPSLEVKSIGLVSAKGNSAGCILAMTTGPADLLKVDTSSGQVTHSMVGCRRRGCASSCTIIRGSAGFRRTSGTSEELH